MRLMEELTTHSYVTTNVLNDFNRTFYNLYVIIINFQNQQNNIHFILQSGK